VRFLLQGLFNERSLIVSLSASHQILLFLSPISEPDTIAATEPAIARASTIGISAYDLRDSRYES
jgi:hypothetical protein